MSEGGGRVHFIPRLLFLMIQEKEDEFYPSGFFIFQNFKKVFKKIPPPSGKRLEKRGKINILVRKLYKIEGKLSMLEQRDLIGTIFYMARRVERMADRLARITGLSGSQARLLAFLSISTLKQDIFQKDIEEEFGIEIPDEEAEKFQTVNDLVKYVDAHVE